MASMRSNIASMRNCSGSMPPSSLIIELRRKPVATTWSWRRARQQVAGDLLDDELVVGQVAVEGVDDPVAVEADLARLVLLVAVGVGVAGGVEPDPAPALAVVRRVQQPIDQLSEGVAASNRLEMSSSEKLGRKPDEVEEHPLEQRGRFRLRAKARDQLIRALPG